MVVRIEGTGTSFNANKRTVIIGNRRTPTPTATPAATPAPSPGPTSGPSPSSPPSPTPPPEPPVWLFYNPQNGGIFGGKFQNYGYDPSGQVNFSDTDISLYNCSTTPDYFGGLLLNGYNSYGISEPRALCGTYIGGFGPGFVFTMMLKRLGSNKLQYVFGNKVFSVYFDTNNHLKIALGANQPLIDYDASALTNYFHVMFKFIYGTNQFYFYIDNNEISNGTADGVYFDCDDRFALGAMTIDGISVYNHFHGIIGKWRLLDYGADSIWTNSYYYSDIQYYPPIYYGASPTPTPTVGVTPVPTPYPTEAPGNLLYAWGNGQAGMLGIRFASGNIEQKNAPFRISALNNWDANGLGNGYTNYNKTNNNLWHVTGNDVFGRAGINTDTSFYTSPVQFSADTNYVQIKGSGNTGIALKSDNSLWVWGSGAYSLGLNTNGMFSSPVQVNGSWSWYDISYQDSVFAIKTDGTLWVWGNNAYGQLGLNSIQAYSSPVQLGIENNWAKISCGFESTFAIKTDGSLWSWGRNNSGQLGHNNFVDISSPVQIGTNTDYSQVYAGWSHVIIKKNDGSLWASGFNPYGSLGLNDTVNRSSPVQIGTDTNWTDVVITSYTTLALKSDGTAWTWGSDEMGLLGANGLVGGIGISSPTQTYYSDNKWLAIGKNFKQFVAIRQS